MNKTFHFISGMPRSGSQLLCNLLMQNPRFYASGTNGILDIMFSVRNQWNELIEFKANPNEEAKVRVLRGILENFYADVDEPIICDKSRGWLAYLEMVELILERPAKVIVPVRDLRDILANFEKHWRRISASRQISQEQFDYFKWQTIEGRCEIWCDQSQVVGLAYNRIKDALHRGFRDRMHFVRFEELNLHPTTTMAKLYEFLEEPFFEHDFNNIEQVIHENDLVYGIPGLHDIHGACYPTKPEWPEYLGEVIAQKYANANLW